MNIENLRNRVDALQKTENTLLVLAMHKAGLKNVNCSDKQLNLCAVLAGNPVIFKVKEFWMEGDSGKETVFFLDVATRLNISPSNARIFFPEWYLIFWNTYPM